MIPLHEKEVVVFSGKQFIVIIFILNPLYVFVSSLPRVNIVPLCEITDAFVWNKM